MLMTSLTLFLFSALFAGLPLARGQTTGNWYPEHPLPFVTWKCTTAGGCEAQNTSLTLDAKSRWLHVRGDSRFLCTNKQREITAAYCPDAESCHNNCVYEGANYTRNGVVAVNNGTHDNGIVLRPYVGRLRTTPRVYLLDALQKNYENVVLTAGMEFSYDVNLSMVPCGFQANLYLISMRMDGSRSPFNEAGAPYGTGYCDSQCPIRDFYNGEPNINGSGSCCGELDFHEGDRNSFGGASHPCQDKLGPFPCLGSACKHTTDGGICSQRSCHTQSADYPALYGQGKRVNTLRPLTLVTQFLSQADVVSEDAMYATTAAGRRSLRPLPQETREALLLAGRQSRDTIVMMRQLFVQDGRFIPKSNGLTGAFLQNSNASCPSTGFLAGGGYEATTKMLAYGMVLSFSIIGADDSIFVKPYPGPTCASYESALHTPAQIIAAQRDAHVTISNVRWGELGSTFHRDGSPW